jgi:hypothetical protein
VDVVVVVVGVGVGVVVDRSIDAAGVVLQCVGVYLSDLTFIEDGNLDMLANGQVNFTKHRMVANVIQELGQYQQTPYNLVRVDAIRLFLDTLDPLSEQKQYQLSLKHEPRARRTKPTSSTGATE